MPGTGVAKHRGRSTTKDPSTDQGPGTKDQERSNDSLAYYTNMKNALAGIPSLRAEMSHYLSELGVDGIITDSPDQGALL